DKIELDSIHVAINKVGHDTDKSKADTAIYSKLPMCCAFRENHKVH
ncbi:MAG: Cu(I)/Ag(I) efflux system membrane fusion protein, partial [Sphingobacteriales bacterium]